LTRQVVNLIAKQCQDVLTGDEVLSDSYDLKEVDDAVYEADCTRITIGGDNVGMRRP